MLDRKSLKWNSYVIAVREISDAGEVASKNVKITDEYDMLHII